VKGKGHNTRDGARCVDKTVLSEYEMLFLSIFDLFLHNCQNLFFSFYSLTEMKKFQAFLVTLLFLVTLFHGGSVTCSSSSSSRTEDGSEEWGYVQIRPSNLFCLFSFFFFFLMIPNRNLAWTVFWNFFSNSYLPLCFKFCYHRSSFVLVAIQKSIQSG